MEYPLYIFLHQYKTGGQTLLANFELNIPRKKTVFLQVGPADLDKSKQHGHPANPGWVREPVDALARKRGNAETRLVVGHFAYFGVHKRIEPARTVRYVTFLRDPIERVVSLYNYLRFNSINHWHRELVASNWTLEEWLEKSEALWAHNGQVRHLLFPTYERECSERELSPELVNEAKRRLSNFWFVGLTENFPSDSLYLYGKMRFRKFISDEVVNATKRKEPVSSAARELIASYNTLDRELYEYACELRARFFARHWLIYQWNIKRAQVRRARFRRDNPGPVYPPQPTGGKKELAK